MHETGTWALVRGAFLFLWCGGCALLALEEWREGHRLGAGFAVLVGWAGAAGVFFF